MQQLLKRIHTRYVIIALAVLLALAVTTLVILLLLPPPQPPAPPTEPPVLQENPYSQQDFIVEDSGFISCLSAQTALGIDVSGFQGQIDWQQVKAAGVEFVFIRVGGRGTTEGGLYADEMADTYYRGAKEAGLQVGAYFFSQAITPQEARQEAEYTLQRIRRWKLDLPVVYDWEWVSSDSRTANVDRTVLTQCTKAFCQVIENAGLEAMIYFNYTQGTELLELEALANYRLWLARYGSYPDFPYQVDCWQYSCTGTVPGITGDVDLNLFFRS